MLHNVFDLRFVCEGRLRSKGPSSGDSTTFSSDQTTATEDTEDSEEAKTIARIEKNADKAFEIILHQKLFHEGLYLRSMSNPSLLLREPRKAFDEHITAHFKEDQDGVKGVWSMLKTRVRNHWDPSSPLFGK